MEDLLTVNAAPTSPQSPNARGRARIDGGVQGRSLRSKGAGSRRQKGVDEGARRDRTQLEEEAKLAQDESALSAAPETAGEASEASSTAASKARAFLDATANGDVDEAFEKVLHDGAMMMRRGTLEDIQKEVFHARRSQRNLVKSVKEAKRATEEVDFLIDNNLRRFTIANAVIGRMSERCIRARETNFVEGSAEHVKWAALRKHTTSVIDMVRKNKLKKDVAETSQRLAELAESQKALAANGDYIVPRRASF